MEQRETVSKATRGKCFGWGFEQANVVEESVPTAWGLELMIFKDPFQPKLFHDSMI